MASRESNARRAASAGSATHDRSNAHFPPMLVALAGRGFAEDGTVLLRVCALRELSGGRSVILH